MSASRLVSSCAAATRACGVLCLLAIATNVATAQSAQPYAVQASALFTTITAGNASISGAGIEVQPRYSRLYATESFGALSLGIGGQ